MISGKTYWLVGASEGLGRALAHAMSKAGANLILSARNPDRLEGLANDLPNARALPMDVTDLQSVRAAAAQLNQIDGLIYCPGAYQPMDATNWQTDATLTMTEVNYIGALRVLGEVLPGLLAQGHGQITLIGSLSAYRGLPGAIGYSASKSALQSLAESLYMDLAGTGLTVQIINPGFIRTRLTDKNSFSMPFILSPEEAATRTLRAIQLGRFHTAFPWPMALFFRIGALLPIGLFRRILARG